MGGSRHMRGNEGSDGRNRPESWLGWGLGAEGYLASRPPEAVTTNPRKAHRKLGKLVNLGRHAAHTASLEQLPETVLPPGPGDPPGRCETKVFTKLARGSCKGSRITWQ